MREDQMSKLDRGLVTSASWDTECLEEFQNLVHTCMGKKVKYINFCFLNLPSTRLFLEYFNLSALET